MLKWFKRLFRWFMVNFRIRRPAWSGYNMDFNVERGQAITNTSSGVELFSTHPLYEEGVFWDWQLTENGLGVKSHSESHKGYFSANDDGSEWSYDHLGGPEYNDQIRVVIGPIDDSDQVFNPVTVVMTFTFIDP